MRIRRRLSLAFFLISVVPLGLVTAYSYSSSAAALRRAVEGQADQMAAEMGDRMAWVMTDLGDRVERLWRMRVDSPAAAAPPAGHRGARRKGRQRSCAPSPRPCWPRPLPWCAASSSNPSPAGPPMRRRHRFAPCRRQASRVTDPGAAAGAGARQLRRPPTGSPGSGSPPGQPRIRVEGGPPGRPGGPGSDRRAGRGARHAAGRDRDAGSAGERHGGPDPDCHREPVARRRVRLAARDSAAGRARGDLRASEATAPRASRWRQPRRRQAPAAAGARPAAAARRRPQQAERERRRSGADACSPSRAARLSSSR